MRAHRLTSHRLRRRVGAGHSSGDEAMEQSRKAAKPRRLAFRFSLRRSAQNEVWQRGERSDLRVRRLGYSLRALP